MLAYQYFFYKPSSSALCKFVKKEKLKRQIMTSKEDAKGASVEDRRRSPLDHLPPPANSNKPLTPFSIEDILNKPSAKRSYTICSTAHLLSSGEKHPSTGHPLSNRALLSQTSPLCALEELASKTFKGLEVSVLQAAEGKHKARGVCKIVFMLVRLL